jgi:hypothetical protein
MAHEKFRWQAKLRVTVRVNVFRLSLPSLRSFSGMKPAGVLEREREAGTDLYRCRVGGSKSKECQPLAEYKNLYV